MQSTIEDPLAFVADSEATPAPLANDGEDEVREGADASDVGGEAALDPEAIEAMAYVVESVLFAAAKPIGVKELIAILGACSNAQPATREVRASLARLLEAYAPGRRGIVLHEIGTGFQFRTARENAEFVRQVFKEKPARLGRATLETLAIISYRQPVTKAEIEAVRGVDADGALGTLLARRLIKIAGRKEAIGRPLLYATTPEFLEAFGLKSLKDLPALEELATAMPEEGEYDEEATEEIDDGDTVAAQDDREQTDTTLSGDDDGSEETAATRGRGVSPAAFVPDDHRAETFLTDVDRPAAIVADDHATEAIVADESKTLLPDDHESETLLTDDDEFETDDRDDDDFEALDDERD